MSDSLFDRLFELFQTNERVNWRLAEELVKSLAGERDPIEPRLAEEYQELALAAHLRLQDSAYLDVGAGIVPHPIDGAGWALANHRGYAYLLEPLADLMGRGLGSEPAAAMLAPLGPAVVGMQAGSVAGFLSHRVLGQFDTALPLLGTGEAYLVVPNIEAFATEHDLDARQVRLWATLHEITAHALSANAVLHARLTAAVADLYDGIEFDPARLMESLNEMQDPSALEGMLADEGGLPSLLGRNADPRAADALAATAAFVEGFGDFVVRSAGAGLLPDLDAIEHAHGIRRTEPNDPLDQLSRIVGLDVPRRRAADAAALCREIVQRWGPEALERLWASPDSFPTLAELADPVGWAARVLLD